MKKLYLILVLLISFNLNAQFEITPDNYKNADDSSKNYVVLDFDDMSQKELFTSVKSFITSKYKGIKFDGFNEVEYNQIVLDANFYDSDTKKLSWGSALEVKNRIEVNFKDNKVRIKPKFVKLETPESNSPNDIRLNGGGLTSSIFNKKGKVRKKKMKERAEKSVNLFVEEVKKYVDSNDDW